MRGLWVVMLGCMAVSAAPAQAAPEPTAAATSDDGAKAVAKARAAFEYRDFAQVIELLDPWLNPPRLRDRALRIEAHRMLGVSLHVSDEVDQARAEFGRLLELDPEHQLDPFVTPPSVIETFAAVREAMRPALEAKDPPPPVETKAELRVVDIPHPATAFLPFGIPQFLLGKTGWGVLWATIQAIGLAVNVGFTVYLTRSSRERFEERKGVSRAIIGSSFAATVGGYGGSVMQGVLQIRQAREQALRPPPPPVGLSYRFSF